MDIELKKLYHFVATEDMLENITKFSSNMNLDRSKTIRLILDTMMPLLDNYIFFGEESSDLGYNEINADVDIRFYIDPTQHHFYSHKAIRLKIEVNIL